MGHGENHGLVAAAIIAVLFQLVVALALTIWAAIVARRQTGRWWRLAPILPMAGAGLGFLGFAVAIGLLVGAFRGVGQLDPEEKTAALAHDIGRAMIPAWTGLAVSGLSFVVSLASSLVGSLRRPGR